MIDFFVWCHCPPDGLGVGSRSPDSSSELGCGSLARAQVVHQPTPPILSWGVGFDCIQIHSCNQLKCHRDAAVSCSVGCKECAKAVHSHNLTPTIPQWWWQPVDGVTTTKEETRSCDANCVVLALATASIHSCSSDRAAADSLLCSNCPQSVWDTGR